MFHFTHMVDFIIGSGTCNKVRHTKLRIAFWKEIKWNGKGTNLLIVCSKSDTTGAISGTGTSCPKCVPGFCGLLIAQYLLCAVFCRSLNVFSFSPNRPLLYLSLFDLRLLITPLVYWMRYWRQWRYMVYVKYQ